MQQSYSDILNPTEKITATQDRFYTNKNGYLWSNSNPKHLRYLHTGSKETFKSRICCGSQYIPQFSYFPSSWETQEADGRVINIIEVLTIMRGRELSQRSQAIEAAKRKGDEVTRAALKKGMPCISHAGIFIPRKNSGMILPGFTYQLDIDDIDNPDEVLQKIIHDRQLDVMFASKSVSGKGVKALLFLRELVFLRDEWNHDQYRQAYHGATSVLSQYFQTVYGIKIDEQMKAISQPFILFSAPDLFIHKNLMQWI